MRTMSYKKRFVFAPLILVALALGIFLTMVLWNALMPPIFHLPEIGYWQAAGLLILGRLLFGRVHHGNHWRENRISHDMREKLKTMTPEERKEYFQKLYVTREAWYNRNYQGQGPRESGTEIK
jgi:hypothetical protein